MDDFERRLGKLRPRDPSPELDRKVLGARPAAPVRPGALGRPVPLWIVAAVALATGIAGFGAGIAVGILGPPARLAPGAPVTFQITQGPSASGNPFDFTRASGMFPPGPMRTTITTKG